MRLYKKDISNTVKEATLQPLKQVIKVFPPEALEKKINCKELVSLLLDEIKFGKPLATGMRAV